MAIVVGLPFVFGLAEELPLRGLPCGVRRVRVRLRAGDFGRLYLKFDTRIEEWFILPGRSGQLEEIECWRPGILRAVNYSPAAPWPRCPGPCPDNPA